MLQASSATVSHVLGQTNAAGMESYARVIHECSTVCACKGAACDLVSSKPFPHNTCNPQFAGPGTLHSTKGYTHGEEHVSLHT